MPRVSLKDARETPASQQNREIQAAKLKHSEEDCLGFLFARETTSQTICGYLQDWHSSDFGATSSVGGQSIAASQIDLLLSFT